MSLLLNPTDAAAPNYFSRRGLAIFSRSKLATLDARPCRRPQITEISPDEYTSMRDALFMISPTNS
jgi:hypothetical protein